MESTILNFFGSFGNKEVCDHQFYEHYGYTDNKEGSEWLILVVSNRHSCVVRIVQVTVKKIYIDLSSTKFECKNTAGNLGLKET